MRILWTFAAHLCALLITAIVLSGQPAQAQIGLPTTGSTAQATPQLPEPLTSDAANALISRLSDSEVRALLLDQLNTQAEAAAQASDGDPSEFVYHATQGAWTSVTVPVERLPKLFTGQAKAFSTFYEKIGGGMGLLQLLGYMILVFGVAGLVEAIFRRMTSGWRILPPADQNNMTLPETLQLLSQRFATQILAVIIFVVLARLLARAIVPETLLPVMHLIGLYLIGFPRMFLAVAFFIFAPQNPEYRLLNVTTPDAKAFCFHNFWLALLLGFSAAIIQFNAMNGVAIGETRLGFWLSLAMHVYLITLLWRYRHAWTSAMLGYENDNTPMEHRIAALYPFFGIAVVLVVWWVINIVVSYGNFELLRTQPQYKTMTLLLLAPLMDTAIRGIVRHSMPAMTGEGDVAVRAYNATKKSYVRIGRVVVFGLVLAAIAGFWGLSATSIATAGVGERFAASIIEFLFILSIGYIIYEGVSLFINRKLAAEYTASGFDPDTQEAGGDGGGAGGSRLSTVLPLVLAVARATIIVVFVLLALGNIGIDTTPLLAGAGIVGLAIGFGAQKLVTDVVSGIFFLVDDAFRTGEYVTVEGTMGTVEKISIRSMQLRHHKGPVHTIPYGEIPKITNFSRDWVIMKLRFTVPFDTDPNKVKKIFKKIGQEMLEIEEFKDDFLAPFKSQGVLEIDDVGMVIRGKFMCKPGTQFMIRKEIYNRVNAAFAQAGLEFARREVRVALPSGAKMEALSAEDQQAITAAASQAAQEQVEESGKV